MRRGLVYTLLVFVILAAGALGATLAAGDTPLLGLDLKGGVSLVLQPTGTANQQQLDEAVSIIDRRVNGLGVSNSDVARQGSDVVINLPGIRNSQQALGELGQTAVLYFRPVLCQIPAYAPTTPATPTPPTTSKATPATSTPPASTPPTTKGALGATAARLLSAPLVAAAGAPSPQPAVSQATCNASNAQNIPTTPIADDTAKASVILPPDPKSIGGPASFRYVLGPADLTGSSVSNAAVQVDPTTGQYTVLLNLTSRGATLFDNMASARYACYLQNKSSPPPCALEAAELDGLVESAPAIEAPSFHGTAQISGSFTQGQASQLANVLKYGSLPIRFVPQSVQTVSATIGKDSLKAGLAAGIGGLIVVMIYMLLYYRALGLVVLAGLAVGGSILYSIITELSYTSFHETLTLAGVTGIIVSIGITVDSYVVYFERLKDEVRSGRTVRQSVERSFTRAFRTVLTADLVSFMAALILYFFAIGDVKGFAFTLGLSTLLDIATAFFFIRPAVILVGRRRSITDNPMFGIARGLGARPTPRQA